MGVSRLSTWWRPSKLERRSNLLKTLRIHLNTTDEDEKTEKTLRNESAHRPAQFRFYSSDLDSPCHASSLNELALTHPPFHNLLETGDHEAMWWLDATDPSEDDIEILSKVYGIHPLTMEDIKVGETREKFEFFGNYYFLSVRPPQLTEHALNYYAIVFRGGILSFTFGPSPHAGNVQHRITEHNQFSLTSDWICYALIDDIVDGFGPLISQVERGIENVDENVSISRPDDIAIVLQRIFRCRKDIIRIRHRLHDKVDVIRCFARHCDGRVSTSPSEVNLYLSDIQDHVLTMMANLSHSEQMLSSSQSKCLGQISMDSTRSQNATVKTLSKLTVIAGIIVPTQIVTMLWGMNVHVPGQDHGPDWWFGIFGVIGAFISLGLIIAKLTRWI